MAKYDRRVQNEVEKTMHEFKHNKRGRIKSPEQAVAIGLSKARRKGLKVPKKKT